jgi:hypothetical protein
MVYSSICQEGSSLPKRSKFAGREPWLTGAAARIYSWGCYMLPCNNMQVLLFADVRRVSLIAAPEAIIHHLMAFWRYDSFQIIHTKELKGYFDRVSDYSQPVTNLNMKSLLRSLCFAFPVFCTTNPTKQSTSSIPTTDKRMINPLYNNFNKLVSKTLFQSNLSKLSTASETSIL